MPKRIATAGFLQETNTFVAKPTAYVDFAEHSISGQIYLGEEVEELYSVNSGVAGCSQVAAEAGIELAPLLWCEAEPGGTVSDEAFERIMGELTGRLSAALPVDGVYLELHGAMAVESFEDAETEIVRRVQAVVGHDIPITCSLDLHGNISPDLIHCCAGISAFRTFPHVDMRESGIRATRQLLEVMTGEAPGQGALIALPFFIPMHQQSTLGEPAASIYREMERYERELDTSAHLSFLMGFYPADTYWTGPSVIAYAADEAAAQAAASHMESFIQAQRPHFSATLHTVKEAVHRAQLHQGAKPLAIAEVQDNPGGGSPGDAMTLVAALHQAGVQGVAVSAIWDPVAVEFLSDKRIGECYTLAVGGRNGYGEPLYAEFELLDFGERRFKGEGPMLGGAHVYLGRTAVLKLGGIRLVVSENRVQNLDQGCFSAVGIAPESERVLVIKSSAHYRAHYGPIIDTFINVDTPGAYPADPGLLSFEKLRTGVARQASLP
ncbi:MAG: M81 family metallopeptidase [Pseudomonadota bacterium]